MIINIKNKAYIGQCNALSYVYYKKLFKINIMEDLENLRRDLINISQGNIKEQYIEEFYKILLRLVHTLIYTKNQDIDNFEKWSENIEKNALSEDIINETIEVFLESFIDEEVVEELQKIPSSNTKTNIFPEHEFLKTCLEYGLSLEDLEKLTYIDVVKIFISSYSERNEEKTTKFKEATQADWDKLASL